MTQMPCSTAHFPIASTAAGGYTAPDGLSGLTKSNAFVRRVRAFSSWSIVTWKPLSASVSMITGTPPAERDRLGIRRPVRGRADDLVARIAQGGERGVHRVLATVRDEHLRPRAVEPGVALGLVRDRLLQLGKATSWRVPVVAHLGTGGDRGIDDVLRGREVGLTRAEPDDVLPLGLQGLGLGVDRQGGRRGDCSESFGGSFHSPQACHSDPPAPNEVPESNIPSDERFDHPRPAPMPRRAMSNAGAHG